jgi:hypothetical protein
MRTNTNGKQAIAGHATSRKAGTEGTGPVNGKGYGTDATLPQFIGACPPSPVGSGWQRATAGRNTAVSEYAQ